MDKNKLISSILSFKDGIGMWKIVLNQITEADFVIGYGFDNNEKLWKVYQNNERGMRAEWTFKNEEEALEKLYKKETEQLDEIFNNRNKEITEYKYSLEKELNNDEIEELFAGYEPERVHTYEISFVSEESSQNLKFRIYTVCYDKKWYIMNLENINPDDFYIE